MRSALTPNATEAPRYMLGAGPRQFEARWLPAAILAIAVGAGVLLPRSPLPVAGALGGLCLVIAAALFAARLPNLFLGFAGVLLAGYAFLGRGFAYLGVPPIYVGEVGLAFGLLAATMSGAVRLALRSPLVWMLIAYDAWGAAQTIPYLQTYGTDALRDAVTWSYSLFAVVVAACLLSSQQRAPFQLSANTTERSSQHRSAGCADASWSDQVGTALARVLDHYRRWLPLFLLCVPILWWLRYAYEGLPRAPGSTVPIPFFKPGDAAVHLAGIAAFLLVGLYRRSRDQERIRFHPPEWLLWSAWLIAVMFVASLTRGGLLAILVSLTAVLALRPAAAGRKVGAVTAVAALSVAFFVAARPPDVAILSAPESYRAISFRQISANVRSIVTSADDGNLEGNRRWRLDWWSTILGYTVFGEQFWTGKGFGVNLADDDGFQVESDGSLRSPHNSHLTILAREGVPGFALWVLLQSTFAVALVRAHLRARRGGQAFWAHVCLWVLAYWLASLTNMGFDVVLEGPQGAIWFWSLFGLGIAAIQGQQDGGRRSAAVALQAWRPM